MQFVGFALALSVAAATVAHAQDTDLVLSVQGLYQTCKAPNGATDASPCIEYIAGIADQMVLNSVLREKVRAESWRLVSSLAICDAPTYGAMRQVFINWAEKHPEKWSNPRSIGVVQALHEAWPCTSQKLK
jgi:hypothetical protein